MFRPCVFTDIIRGFLKSPLSNSLHLSKEHVNSQLLLQLAFFKKLVIKSTLHYKSLWAWRRLSPRILWHGIN
jgi:hypothetical protein